MPVFRLTKALAFPPVHYAEPDGLLAVGGDLSPERLLLAYKQGIFPWYSEGYPILWWSPDPRMVLFPGEIRVSRSLTRVVRKKRFQITFDRVFREVMVKCAGVPRKRGEGTWIVPEMIDAYHRLHLMGYAHSVESWHEGRLVGGLYGIALGQVFFGESMFAEMTDASKVAFVHLVAFLQRTGFIAVDCQVATSHLRRFGAREIGRREFIKVLRRAGAADVPPGPWKSLGIGIEEIVPIGHVNGESTEP